MDHDIERILENWAKWKAGDGYGGAMSCSPLYDMGPRAPRYGNVMPILNGEAEDIDKIINSLDERLKRAISIQYLWGDTQQQKAKRCGCCLNTFKARLDKAKQMIVADRYRMLDSYHRKKCLQTDSKTGIKAQTVISDSTQPAASR